MKKLFLLRLLISLFCLELITSVLYAQNNSLSCDTYFRFSESENLPILLINSDNNLLSLSVENRYFLKEMTSERFSCSFAYRRHRFFASVQHTGFSRFGELLGRVGYGLKLSPRFAIVSHFYYSMFHAKSYNPVHSITFDLSLCAEVNDQIGVVLQAYNPAHLHYGIVSENPIPITLQSMLYYKIHRDLFLSAQLSKDLPGNWDVNLSAYYVVRCLALKGTMSLHSLSADISCQWRSLLFSLRSQYDYQVGFSQSAVITFSWSQK